MRVKTFANKAEVKRLHAAGWTGEGTTITANVLYTVESITTSWSHQGVPDSETYATEIGLIKQFAPAATITTTHETDWNEQTISATNDGRTISVSTAQFDTPQEVAFDGNFNDRYLLGSQGSSYETPYGYMGDVIGAGALVMQKFQNISAGNVEEILWKTADEITYTATWGSRTERLINICLLYTSPSPRD